MGGISELDMEYSFDCFFRQRWTDARLVYNAESAMNYTSLALSFQMFSKIWKPDTYFYNGRRSYIHSVPHVNRFFRIATDGTILYSQRLIFYFYLFEINLDQFLFVVLLFELHV